VLTVGGLVKELDLQLAAGEEGAERPIRWVHISEIADPTPWLSGGELLLTTGIQLSDAERQRQFVRLLNEYQLAGLGLGTGFDHEKLPAALVKEAGKLGFPLFEVPYEMPFIAITEAAFARLVNEQYDVLQRGIDLHKRLERLVLEERGLGEIAKAIATAIGGTALVLDARGEEMASQNFRRRLPDGALEAISAEVAERAGAGHAALFAPGHPELAERALAYPVAAHGGGAAQAWLVAVRDSGALGDFERLILQQAAVVVALELMRDRVARETERRLAGDVLAGAVSGRLEPEELRGRLAPFGIGPDAAVIVFALAEPREAEAALERQLGAAGCPALVAAHGAHGRELLCAVVDADGHDPLQVAARAREGLAAERPEVRAAASRPVPVDGLRRAWHEARCALEATAISNGDAPPVASHRDLGAFTLLLALNDEDALRAYCDNVLEPIDEGDVTYGGELTRSLEAFIEQNGQWERAARELYCHRHTLRYRIRRIEELTGRDLSRAQDRIELWLALRARELVT